jgi:glycosyltransferase involved in cell wall biosynthesis
MPNLLFHSLKGLEHAADMARLVRSINRDKAAVVHFQWLPLPAIDVAAVRSIRRSIGPVVLTVHDTAPFNGSPTSKVQQIGSTSVWHEFDHLIVHSEASKPLLAARGLPIDRISAIPHGILGVATARARTVQADAPLVFLMFGRVKVYKGVDLMIEAVARLPTELRARCQVLVVGDPMMPMDPLLKLAEDRGVASNMKWDLRYVSEADMGDVFSQADFFAFPYREIDTSGVLMACLPFGKPIVASGLGAFQKLLQDGIHGRVIPPNDVDALADAIGSLLANPSLWPAYGRNVAMLSGQIPTWEAIAGKTMALYENLLAERAGRRRATTQRAMLPQGSGKAADFVR